jgi:hypothetical protein
MQVNQVKFKPPTGVSMRVVIQVYRAWQREQVERGGTLTKDGNVAVFER